MAGPFEGLTVVDFGRYIAVPYAAALLADMGANVIRIEKKDGSEDRQLVPLSRDADGNPQEGALFMQMNRNKKSITLDPAHPDGREVVKRLIKSADVVMANLPGETLKSLGLDYDSVSAVNPRAIVAVATAYGLEGPYANRVGFDGVAQAMSGSAWFSGGPGQPVRAAVAWVDFGSASLIAFGVAAALRAREQTGKGQLVEGALLRTALTYFSTTLIEEDKLKIGREPTWNLGQTSGPGDILKTKDGWVVVAVNGNPLFRRVAKLVGRPDWLEDPRFATDIARGDNNHLLSEALNAWCATRTTEEAVKAFEGARVPCSPVYRPRQALDDPHVQAGGFFVDVDYPTSGKVKVAATPVKLHGTPGTVRNRPPTLGEHTDEVLTGLGYSKAEIAALREKGAI
jgi:crotonobetainyl-CoA:carnitine CoA-transferase CaiB-like acyl-CoA transferase